MSKYKALLEVCVADLNSLLVAIDSGVERIELCQGLGVGGLTPSVAMIKYAKKMPALKTFTLIRNRVGDFLYSKAEKNLLLDEISIALDAGSDGIVIGALTDVGNVDVNFMKSVISLCGDKPVTFHRAFDLCSNPRVALNQLVDLGCSRVLSSGCASTAFEGVSLLSDLVTQAQDNIVVMPGCGITSDNVLDIVNLTGAKEVHASCSSTICSQMKYRSANVHMGNSDFDEYAYKATDAQKVNSIQSQLLLPCSEFA